MIMSNAHAPKLSRRRGHPPLRAFAVRIVTTLPLCALALGGCVSDRDRVRDKTYVAMLNADLRSLRNRQEAHFVDSARYASQIEQLRAYGPAHTTQVTILEGSATGWAAKATHDSLPDRSCVVSFRLSGSRPAKPIATDKNGLTATEDGQVVCDTIP
jgi:hypothetical protein